MGSYKHTIPLRDALCGVSIKVPTLESDVIPLKISSVIKPGSTHRYNLMTIFDYIPFLLTFRIKERGLPNPKTGQRGDLIVEFDVRFPDSISPTAKELIQNALPPN